MFLSSTQGDHFQTTGYLDIKAEMVWQEIMQDDWRMDVKRIMRCGFGFFLTRRLLFRGFTVFAYNLQQKRI